MKNFSMIIVAVFFISCSKKADIRRNAPDELEKRIEKISGRIISGNEPKFTQDFILADVSLDTNFRRRFTNFSGDISGRYLSAFAGCHLLNPAVDIRELARKVIACQKPDGRFGSDTLLFKPGKLENNHMALLWGNGRLLVGMLDYYEVYGDSAALKACIRLGNFLLGVGESCLNPVVAKQFESRAAMGYICYTQLIEGLVKLYKYTHDTSYLTYASKIYPSLPERGTQHSHGYLNTLRGILMLYKENSDANELAFVTQAFSDLVHSSDYLTAGGVPEYFGEYASVEDYRDEGCSIADFLMLSLELWKVSGNMEYLEYAEHCLVNQMFLNQFETGDFGHHHIKPGYGFVCSPMEGRAWWCCDFHALKALYMAREAVFTACNDRIRLNLFYQSHVELNGCDIELIKGKDTGAYSVVVNKAPEKNIQLDIRVPSWASLKEMKYNGIPIDPAMNNGYAIPGMVLKTGDKISLKLICKARIHTLDGTFELSQFQGRKVNGVLQYGPWLLGIDDVFSPAFISEPSMENVIRLPVDFAEKNRASTRNIPAKSLLAEAYFTLAYTHESFYEDAIVTIRPISEYSWQKPGNLRLWINYAIQ